MVDPITENVEQKVVGDIISKVNPQKKVFKYLKNLAFILIVFKWTWSALKEIGKLLSKVADNNRRAMKMSITDSYDEGKVWITVFWIKWRWCLLGLTSGVLLQYYLDLFTKIEEWVQFIINVIR